MYAIFLRHLWESRFSRYFSSTSYVLGLHSVADLRECFPENLVALLLQTYSEVFEVCSDLRASFSISVSYSIGWLDHNNCFGSNRCETFTINLTDTQKLTKSTQYISKHCLSGAFVKYTSNFWVMRFYSILNQELLNDFGFSW